ncbi:MAG TPA: hypothetical protein VG843_12490 [Rhizomicrobium sp.]|nr:hypothetical protein [Rhizomicrobium sp.]
MTKKTIECSKHGVGDTVFVCNHLVLSMREGVPRGLFQWFDENGNVCAWCEDCAKRAEASGNGPDRTPLKFKVETLCDKCFEQIRRMNSGGILYR